MNRYIPLKISVQNCPATAGPEPESIIYSRNQRFQICDRCRLGNCQAPQGRLRRTRCLESKRQWVGRPFSFRARRLASLHPGLKPPTSQRLRRGWLFGVTYHNMRGAIASATAAWAILLDRFAVIDKCPNSRPALKLRPILGAPLRGAVGSTHPLATPRPVLPSCPC